MWLKLTQFRAPITTDEERLPVWIQNAFSLPHTPRNLLIRRKSLDARPHPPVFVYTVFFEMELTSEELSIFRSRYPELTSEMPPVLPESLRSLPVSPVHRNLSENERPVIVGAGPAGLFAALRLAAAGFRPVLLERGDGLTERIAKVTHFWETGELDPESNIQYGIGGAGTFSDGKLTSRSNDPMVEEILRTLVRLGAPPEIVYWQSPHIGTDLLREVVSNLEQLIREYGGEIHFRHKLTDLRLIPSNEDFGKTTRRIAGIIVNEQDERETNSLVLAAGNSARDLYRLAYRHGLQIIAKPMAVGVRIEHPQDLIDRGRYGRSAGDPKLGPAEYRLTYQHRETGRGVYTFCMCPGGQVVGATSETGRVVTNGMSFYARNSGLANAAVVVTVNQKDYGSEEPLAGVFFQERLEDMAFRAGGGRFFAPAQRVGDFFRREPSLEFQTLIPSYKPGITPGNLWEVLPEEICQAIRDGIGFFGRQLKGFDWPEAVLTGVETRTSAPVRIIRNEAREAEGVTGIYPVGEGAGYAGGIISAAVDGWKTAEAIIARG